MHIAPEHTVGHLAIVEMNKHLVQVYVDLTFLVNDLRFKQPQWLDDMKS